MCDLAPGGIQKAVWDMVLFTLYFEETLVCNPKWNLFSIEY